MENSYESRNPQVFINFRGKAQRGTLVSFLKSKLEEISGINVFIDEYEIRGRPITALFERIRESSIALVIFSDKYPESCWYLDELVEIKNQMEKGLLVPFPIFYKVEAYNVKTPSGYFLNTLLKTEDYLRQKVDRSSSKSILETEARIWGWRQALVSVGRIMGFSHYHKGDDDFVNDIVVKVKEMLDENLSPRNDLLITERPPMHPQDQEAVTWLLQALNLKTSDLEDLITKPSIQISSVVSQSTDHLLFLDLISLKNHIHSQRLSEPFQAGSILLVLLGSIEYYNKGFAFKRLFLPKKQMPECTDVAAERNDNEVINFDAALSCISFVCNILKRFELKIDSPSRRVFMSFGEKHLGKFFVSCLKRELESNQILVHVKDETKSRIKECRVAIVVFSNKYPKSEKCLDELVEIKKLMDAGDIDPIPVFYNLKAESVKELKGFFRNRLLKIEDEVRKNVKRRDHKSIFDTEAKIWGYRQALLSIALRQGLSYEHLSTNDAFVFVSDVVTKVKELFVSRKIQKTEAATTTTVVKSLDDDLFYSLTSFLQAIDLEITDFEGFTDISNGLVLLRLKGNTNLVFLKLRSHENLVRFQRSDSFKFQVEDVQKQVEYGQKQVNDQWSIVPERKNRWPKFHFISALLVGALFVSYMVRRKRRSRRISEMNLPMQATKCLF